MNTFLPYNLTPRGRAENDMATQIARDNQAARDQWPERINQLENLGIISKDMATAARWLGYDQSWPVVTGYVKAKFGGAGDTKIINLMDNKDKSVTAHTAHDALAMMKAEPDRYALAGEQQTRQPNTTETEREVARLKAEGHSDDDAHDIAFNRIRQITNPVTGQPAWFNLRTGKPWTPSRVAPTRPTAPVVASSPAPSTTFQAPAPPAPAPQLASTPLPAPPPVPSSPPPASRGNQQPPPLAPVGDQPPPPEVPPVSKTTRLWDLADATGIVPALKEAGSAVTGQMGLPVATDTIAKRQTLQNETQNLVRALAINPRFPQGEMDALKKEVDIQPSVVDSPDSMRARMVAINASLSRRLQNEQRAAQDGSLPPDTRKAAAQAANDIGNFLHTLGVPQDMGGYGPPASSNSKRVPRVGEVVDGYRYKGGPPKDPTSWEPVKK
jgi:hypothetical protein